MVVRFATFVFVVPRFAFVVARFEFVVARAPVVAKFVLM